jgi:hypothetical protein
MAKELDDIFKDLMGGQPGQQLEIEGLNPPSPAAQQDIDTVVSNVQKEPEEGKAEVSAGGAINEPTDSVPPAEDKNWDDFVSDAPTTDAPEASKFNWESFGKAAGLPETVKDETSAIEYINTLKAELEQLSKSTLPETLPKELKEAIEIANNGGDFRTYLEIADIDYAAEDPVALFEDEVAELFYEQDGSFRQEEFDEYINSISEPDKLLRGRQIQRELISLQEQKKNEIRQRAAMEKAENLRRLETSLNNFNKVGNYNVTPKVKKQMFSDLSTGKFMDDLGLSTNGSHNWDKLLNNYFKAKYFDAIQQFNEQRAVTQDRRSTLEELTNPSNKQNPRIENPVQTVKKSAVDLYLERYNLK